MVFSKTFWKHTAVQVLAVFIVLFILGILFGKGYIGSYTGFKIGKNIIYNKPKGYRAYGMLHPYKFNWGYMELKDDMSIFSLSSEQSFVPTPFPLDISLHDRNMSKKNFSILHQKHRKYEQCLIANAVAGLDVLVETCLLNISGEKALVNDALNQICQPSKRQSSKE